MTIGLLIGTDEPEVRVLAAALAPASSEWCPELPDASSAELVDARLEEWRDGVGDGPPVASVVVAAWSPSRPASPFDQLSDGDWATRLEQALACWFASLGAAVRRCADGGRVVAVVERPSPLDAAGRAVEAGVAEAVEALVRSLARSQGGREVRVNAVSTPIRVVPATVVAPAPPLPSFPGTVETELAQAVQMFTGPGVDGVTGTMLHVDGGRSWR
ncbi:MAG: SDR family oxidoreductase [Microthrixaceae bacterium]